MILTAQNLYQTLDSFRVLPEKISSADETTFKRTYGQSDAAIEKGIVYLFRSEKLIPRLKGESDVLYIGQTKGTFKQRYLPTVELHATSRANKMKFEHIVSLYGSIRITLAPYSKFGEDLLKAEGQLLWWYFQNHCEYPPINYTKTRVRNDAVSID